MGSGSAYTIVSKLSKHTTLVSLTYINQVKFASCFQYLNFWRVRLKSQMIVTIIHSMPSAFWTNAIDSGIRTELTSFFPSIEIHSCYIPEQTSQICLKRSLSSSAVIVTNSPDDETVLSELSSRKIPTFIAGIQRRPHDNLENFNPETLPYQSGVVEVYKAKESLAILKSIKPSIKKIGAISPPDKIMKNIFTCILKDIDNGYYEVRGKIEKTLEG